MENKEAILDNPMNIAVEIWDMTNPMVTANMNKTSYLIGCCEGLKYSRNHESFASQNEELQKAFENNKEQLMELATHARDLESTIDEKDKELANLGFTITALDIMITEKDKEIERLKGLIEDAHNSGWRRGYSLHTQIDESLQQFKSENNL